MGCKSITFLGLVMLYSVGLAAPLTITGVSEPVEANIRLHLDISDAPCETPTWQLESWWENAEEQAKTALQAFGYFSPEVDLRPVARDQACWHASMQVKPGEPTTITAVDLNLGDAQTPSRWPSALRDAIQAIHDLKGQTLVSSAYESRKSQLIFTAAAEGVSGCNTETQSNFRHPG